MAGKAANGQGSLYKESDPRRKTRWRYERYATLPNGRSVRVITRGVTQAEALKKFEERARALTRANPAADQLELGEYLERWLEHMRPRVKRSTYHEYRRNLEIHVIPRIGAMRLSRVRPLHVQEVINQTAATGKYAAANNARRYLKQAFRQAERWELISHNPLANIEPVPRPPPKHGKWERDEITRFLKAAEGSVYHGIFYAALFTGMRQGELRGLEWEAVGESTLTVYQTASRYAQGKLDTPKTPASARIIPMGPELKEVILSQPRRGRFVFSTGRGTMMTARNILRAFESAIAKAEVPRIKFHDMRRIAATFWARKGFTPKQIMKLLGHSTPHVALSVYTQVLEEQMEAAYLSEADLLSGGDSGGDVGEDNDTQVPPTAQPEKAEKPQRKRKKRPKGEGGE